MQGEGFVPGWVDGLIHGIAEGIELAGIAIIVVGMVFSSASFLRKLAGPDGFTPAYHRFRADLGRGILIGLEFLVAADIIGTVAVEPSFRNLGILAVIVLIRTFLSFSLEAEIDGHWPWQQSAYRDRGKDQKL
jgi:uncharacterized membrane protein